MIHAYSDSGTFIGHSGTISVATSLFLTESTYIDTLTKVYRDVESTTEGELLGICQSLEYLTTKYPNEIDIEVITDSETLANRYLQYLAGKKPKKSIKYFERWRRLMELSKDKNITVSHIRGHQDEHNPNKVCDMLSANLLQRMR